eukprot:tig00000489_g1373.t1
MSAATELRVCSFNVRLEPGVGEPVDPYPWAKRLPLCVSTIEFHRIDLVSIQEAFAHQAKDLADALPEFTFVMGAARDGVDGERLPIALRTRRFEVVSSRNFWFSETPSKVGSMSWDSTCPRHCHVVTVRDWGAGGRRLLLLNAHLDHAGSRAKVEAGRILHGLVQESELPAIILGDFNSTPFSPPYNMVTTGSVHRVDAPAPTLRTRMRVAGETVLAVGAVALSVWRRRVRRAAVCGATPPRRARSARRAGGGGRGGAARLAGGHERGGAAGAEEARAEAAASLAALDAPDGPGGPNGAEPEGGEAGGPAAASEQEQPRGTPSPGPRRPLHDARFRPAAPPRPAPARPAARLLTRRPRSSIAPHHGPLTTFTGFPGTVSVLWRGLIDFCFVTDDWTVLRHGVIADDFGGPVPSDHRPVVADVVLRTPLSEAPRAPALV